MYRTTFALTVFVRGTWRKDTWGLGSPRDKTQGSGGHADGRRSSTAVSLPFFFFLCGGRGGRGAAHDCAGSTSGCLSTFE